VGLVAGLLVGRGNAVWFACIGLETEIRGPVQMRVLL